MQFNVLSTIALLFAVASAMPSTTPAAGAIVEKRTCGTLTGTALTVCQDACVAACDLVTGALAKSLCKKACDLGPL